MKSLKDPARSVVKEHAHPEDADASTAAGVPGPAETDVTTQHVQLHWVHGETHPATDQPAADAHVRTVDGLPVE